LLQEQFSFRSRLSAQSAVTVAGLALLLVIPFLESADAAQKKTAAAKAPAKTAAKATAKTPAKKPATKAVATKKTPAKAKAATAKVPSGPWKAPNFADSAHGDVWEGDDPDVRQAALDALGKLNGAVVVSDANTGRILTVVGQKTAYKDGFQPCSTIKVPVALAALSESLVDRLTQIRLYGNTKMAMTEALARSNNQYFASLGEKLGFERMSYYARLYGLGEKASLNIAEEQPGILPARTPKSGMGMMTSFGDGITLTPLQYAALIGAVANGGTLYYLQYPQNPQEADVFVPKVKRKLDIEHLVEEIKPGMMGAVEYGTARRIGYHDELPIYGKTGTCTDSRTPTHMGWFGSFTEVGHERLVVVVMLTGGSAMSGGSAAGVGGNVYKNLVRSNYYAHDKGPSERLDTMPLLDVAGQ
jgi:penicillin-binding protein 2